MCLVLGNLPNKCSLFNLFIPSFGPRLTFYLLHDITALLCNTYMDELALGATTCLAVVCVCVVNLMIVYEAGCPAVHRLLMQPQ